MICTLDNVAIKAIATYVPKDILEMDSLNDLFGEDKVKVIKNQDVIRNEKNHVNHFFSDYNIMKLEINYRKKNWKTLETTQHAT